MSEYVSQERTVAEKIEPRREWDEMMCKYWTCVMCVCRRRSCHIEHRAPNTRAHSVKLLVYVRDIVRVNLRHRAFRDEDGGDFLVHVFDDARKISVHHDTQCKYLSSRLTPQLLRHSHLNVDRASSSRCVLSASVEKNAYVTLARSIAGDARRRIYRADERDSTHLSS